MNVNDVITKHYDELHKYVSNNVVISLSNTEEDILHNVLITAMNKYKNDEVEEAECLAYIKKTLYYEQKFQQKKKSKDLHIYMDDISAYNISDDDF